MKQVKAHPMQKYIGKNVRMNKNVVLTVVNINTAVNYATGKIEKVLISDLEDKEIISKEVANAITRGARRGKRNLKVSQINRKYNW